MIETPEGEISSTGSANRGARLLDTTATLHEGRNNADTRETEKGKSGRAG